jgi:hypothetical protein
MLRYSVVLAALWMTIATAVVGFALFQFLAM